MVSFTSDYIAGTHPDILRKLVDTNMEALSGYGTDKYCESASRKIKEVFNCPEAQVFFLTGGTQTNQVVISTVLRDYEGVIAADSGHVSVHEAGAIEYSGHKVLSIKGSNGKLTAEAVDDYIGSFYADENHEHMVFPGMVYISFPTEYGTLYSKQELSDLYAVCQKHKVTLYIDGARLGYGLASSENDISITEIAGLCDVFYIGGTKVGALCGEAVVFTHNNAPVHFYTMIKQRGAMLAKGRLVGISFDTLFTDDLYMQISGHAIELAQKLKQLILDKGYELYIDSPTNQQFLIIDNEKLKKLSENVEYSFWEKYNADSTVIRLATSWSTKQEDLVELEKYL